MAPFAAHCPKFSTSLTETSEFQVENLRSLRRNLVQRGRPTAKRGPTAARCENKESAQSTQKAARILGEQNWTAESLTINFREQRFQRKNRLEKIQLEFQTGKRL